MQAQRRKESTEGKIHHSFSPLAPRDTCPSCVDESAYIFWQFWAKGFVKRNQGYCFDWFPVVMLGTQNAFKCDCATASENKTRAYRASKREGCLLFLLTEDNDLALWPFPWHAVHAGTDSRISKNRERPPWPGKALEVWACIAWHSSWPVMTDVLIKVALACRV